MKKHRHRNAFLMLVALGVSGFYVLDRPWVLMAIALSMLATLGFQIKWTLDERRGVK